MTTVIKEATFSQSADTVWGLIADVGNVPALTSMIESSQVEGTTRVCTLAGGGELKESLLSVDSTLRRLAYRVHESPFPLEEHAASLVVRETEGGCVLTWTTDFLPASAEPMFREAADAMFTDLVQRVGAL